MLERASLTSPATLSEEAVRGISQALMPLLCDVFALYLKTKNFHWHMSGPHFRFQRIVDNDAEYVKPLDMIAELRDDNATLTKNMREVHLLCDEADDVATASLLENWIDETEKRIWFLFECGRHT
jgi:starvation-inducible DNA-binding protein